MRYGILIRLIVLYKVSTIVQSETRQDSGEDEISEIEALLDYDQGLIYYKDIGLQLCFVENVLIKLNSPEKVDLPILKIPIVSPDGSNLTYNESSKSMKTSALGLTFCDGFAIVHQNELLQETVRSNRKKRQTYGNTAGGYYGGGSGQYPLGAAGAQTNTNPGQASQAQVQGQVFGRGIFSGQAQSQNGGLSQSQVQLAGIGVSGQISSSSGNAQAQLALGTGAGSGQASGLGVGPSNSQVQVTLGQQGEESMASASATSGGASAGASSGGPQAGGGHLAGSGSYGGGAYGQPGGGTGWIPGVGYGGNRGQLESVSPGLSQDASGRGGAAFYPGAGSQIPQQTGGGGIPSGSSHGGIPGGGVGTHYGGNGVGGHPSYTQPGSINGVGGLGSQPYGGVATNGYGSDSGRLGSGLRANGLGHQIGGSGLGPGLPGVRNGHGSGISGAGSDLSTSGTGYQQGTRPLQAGNGGVGTLPTSVGLNGQHGVPGTYVRPGVPGYDSQGTGVGPSGLPGTGISSGRTVGGNGYNTGANGGGNGYNTGANGGGSGYTTGTNGGGSGYTTGTNGGGSGYTTGTNGGGSGYTTSTNGGGANGKYGLHGPASGTHGPTFGNGNGRPFAQSNTPGAYAATYGGIGQAQAQTVYFGNIGNGQYVPVRYAQSSQPGNGRDQSRYQDQQVGYGTAGQRQQVQGPQPSQNGYGRVATNGVRTIQPVTNGHPTGYTNGGSGLPVTNGHQTGYTNGGSGLPGKNGHQPAYTNGGGGSLPGTNGHQTGYTNGAVSGVPGTNGHQTGYTNGGASGLPGTNGHQTGYTNGGGSGAPGVQIPAGTNGIQTHTGDLGATRVQQQPSTTGTALGPGQLGFDGTGTTGLQGPLGPGIAQPQTTGYTNGVSRGVQNGYRPATTITNGRNGHSYTPAIHGRQPTYTSYPGSGISTPAVNGNGQAYRINEYGQVVPTSQQTRPQQQPISGLPGTSSQGRDQNGYSPSYGVAKPSQEDPDGKKCTIITFSCTIVIESNGRAKICKPNAVKMNGNGNGNGHLASNGNGRTGGSGSNVCCC